MLYRALKGWVLVLVLFFSGDVSAKMSIGTSFLVIPPKVPVTEPVLSDDPYQAVPIGFGPAASNGENLRLQVGLNEFDIPVDIYFLIYAPNLSSEFYLLRSDYTLQPLSSGLEPWKSNTTGPVNETLFDVSLSSISEELYYFIVVVTPAGAITSSLTQKEPMEPLERREPLRQPSGTRLETQLPAFAWVQAIENKKIAGTLSVYLLPYPDCSSQHPEPDYGVLFFHMENNKIIGTGFDLFEPDVKASIEFDWKCSADDEGYYRFVGDHLLNNLRGHLMPGGKEIYFVFDYKTNPFKLQYILNSGEKLFEIDLGSENWESGDFTMPFKDGAVLGDPAQGGYVIFLDFYRR